MPTKTMTAVGVRPVGTRLAEIARAGASTLGSLTGREVRVEADPLTIRTGDELLGRIAQPLLLLRNRLTGGRGSIDCLVGRRDAITLSCLTRPGISTEEVLHRRLTSVLEKRDVESLQDVAWIFAESGNRIVRDLTGDMIGLGLEEIAPMTPENCARFLPPTREHGVVRVRLLLDGLPPTELSLIVEPKAYDLLDAEDPTSHAIADEVAAGSRRSDARSTGRVHAFLEDERAIDAMRECCRRLEADLELHPGSKAPNPSAIRDGIVVIDAPVGSVNPFDWCQRLKQARPGVGVAALVHHPTRARVLQAFEARADAVVAWPSDPMDLAIRLRKLLLR